MLVCVVKTELPKLLTKNSEKKKSKIVKYVKSKGFWIKQHIFFLGKTIVRDYSTKILILIFTEDAKVIQYFTSETDIE